MFKFAYFYDVSVGLYALDLQSRQWLRIFSVFGNFKLNQLHGNEKTNKVVAFTLEIPFNNEYKTRYYTLNSFFKWEFTYASNSDVFYPIALTTVDQL